jgi:F0F1-type ATP synthase assembly protein I
MAATIGALVYLGLYLDEKYHTKPTYTLIFSILGVVISIYRVIKQLLK